MITVEKMRTDTRGDFTPSYKINNTVNYLQTVIEESNTQKNNSISMLTVIQSHFNCENQYLFEQLEIFQLQFVVFSGSQPSCR